MYLVEFLKGIKILALLFTNRFCSPPFYIRICDRGPIRELAKLYTDHCASPMQTHFRSNSITIPFLTRII